MSFPIGHDSSVAMQQEPIYWSYRFHFFVSTYHFFVWPMNFRPLCNRKNIPTIQMARNMVHLRSSINWIRRYSHWVVPFFSTVNRWGKHLHEMLRNGAARYVHAGFPCFPFLRNRESMLGENPIFLPDTRPGKRLQFANWKITIFNR